MKRNVWDAHKYSHALTDLYNVRIIRIAKYIYPNDSLTFNKVNDHKEQGIETEFWMAQVMALKRKKKQLL